VQLKRSRCSRRHGIRARNRLWLTSINHDRPSQEIPAAERTAIRRASSHSSTPARRAVSRPRRRPLCCAFLPIRPDIGADGLAFWTDHLRRERRQGDVVLPMICFDNHFVMASEAGDQERSHAAGTHVAECHRLDVRVFHLSCVPAMPAITGGPDRKVGRLRRRPKRADRSLSLLMNAWISLPRTPLSGGVTAD
jgi:hypothetical protein